MIPTGVEIRIAHVNAAVAFSSGMPCETWIGGVIDLRIRKAFAIEGVVEK